MLGCRGKGGASSETERLASLGHGWLGPEDAEDGSTLVSVSSGGSWAMMTAPWGRSAAVPRVTTLSCIEIPMDTVGSRLDIRGTTPSRVGWK